MSAHRHADDVERAIQLAQAWAEEGNRDSAGNALGRAVLDVRFRVLETREVLALILEVAKARTAAEADRAGRRDEDIPEPPFGFGVDPFNEGTR